MKSYLLMLSFCGCLVLAPLTNAAAATSAEGLAPDETVKHAVTQLKKSKSLLVLLNYVDWDKAFTKIPKDELAMMNIRNGEDYRLYVYTKLTAPKESLMQEAKFFFQNIPEENRGRVTIEDFEPRLASMAVDMAEAFEKVRKQFVQAEYTVGAARVAGDKAFVMVTSNLEGPMESEEVLLEKKGNYWLFPSLEVFLGEAEERPVRMQSLEEMLTGYQPQGK